MDDQNPFAAPQADLDPVDIAPEAPGAMVREGETLLVWEGQQPPPRCVVCNCEATETLKVRAWREGGQNKMALPAIVFMAMVGGLTWGSLTLLQTWNLNERLQRLCFLIPYLIASSSIYFIRSRNLTKFPFCLCKRHQTRHRVQILLLWLSILPMAIGFIDSTWNEEHSLRWVYLMIFGQFAFWSYHFLYIRRTGLAIRVVPNQFAPYVFQGFGKEYLESFPTADELTASDKA